MCFYCLELWKEFPIIEIYFNFYIESYKFEPYKKVYGSTDDEHQCPQDGVDVLQVCQIIVG